MQQNKADIWNNSRQAHQERIKRFWLSLEEDERKPFTRFPKDDLLEKIRNSAPQRCCSCTICQRENAQVQDVLGVLCDAYYEELDDILRDRALDFSHLSARLGYQGMKLLRHRYR